MNKKVPLFLEKIHKKIKNPIDKRRAWDYNIEKFEVGGSAMFNNKKYNRFYYYHHCGLSAFAKVG